MTVCNDCNKEYKVVVDIDGRNMDANKIEMETPYCPFCGEVSLDMDGNYNDEMDL
jgi:hypothetical protein